MTKHEMKKTAFDWIDGKIDDNVFLTAVDTYSSASNSNSLLTLRTLKHLRCCVALCPA
jgi:hypothetical protein